MCMYTDELCCAVAVQMAQVVLQTTPLSTLLHASKWHSTDMELQAAISKTAMP
jgi:hypothetical protein